MSERPASTTGGAAEPYSVTLELRPVGAAGSPVFDVSLRDHQVAGTTHGEASLDFADKRSFLDSFLRGDVVLAREARAFGIELSTRLFGKGQLKELWNQIQQRRNHRPLRLELVLPASLPGGGMATGVALEELPFELMTDSEGGYWFRRPGWSLVRTFEGLPTKRYRLPAGSRALLAWANPLVTDQSGTAWKLPKEIFDKHEAAFQCEAGALGMTVLPPCQRATREELATRLRAQPETPLLALVAHGDIKGGALILHAAAGSDEPDAVLARDLGGICKRGGVQIAFLWSCHGARRHSLRSSTMAALLHPDEGDVAAVVASHAALVAERTARFVAPLLRSLRDVAAGDLERAVTEARHEAMDEDDVQWAAPVYYARPLQGRSVTLEQAIEESLAASVSVPENRVVFGAPAARSWFRGREDESTRALGLLKAHRLVTLTGMPGIGKTTLAVQLCQRLMAEPSLALERGFWLDLSTTTAAAALREEVASLFGFNPDHSPTDRALALKIGQQRALLVLDNAEDLLSRDVDGFRSLLDTMLRYAPGLRLLLTSRRAVGHLEGAEEHSLPVGRLAPGIDRQVFVAVAGERLVAERADGATVNALVQALDGHPQSIVLVASQVGRGLSLAELKARVEAEDSEVVRHADLLDEELEGSDEKLRTRRLVNSLNLSFEPLVRSSPGAAEVFVWLAAFPAGLPELLASEVFGDEAKRAMARLLAFNLIERSGPDQRWVLPGPVRWYASARQAAQVGGKAVLDEQRRQVLLEGSVQAAGSWLRALRTKLGQPGAASACVRAQGEGANLVSLATQVRGREPGNSSLFERLASAFADYGALASYGSQHVEAVVLGEKLLRIVEVSQSSHCIAVVSEALGDLYVRTARLAEAQRAYEQALPIYRAIEDRLGEANTLKALGDLYVRTDRLAEAQRAYEQALPIYRAIEDRLGEANTLKALGDLYVRTDRLAEAQRAYEQALPIYRAIEDRLGEANTLKALGDLYVRTARLAEAQRAYEQALPIYRAIEARLGEANTLQALGDLYVRTDRLAEAQRAYEQALPIYRAIEARLGEANTLKALGDLYVRTARLAEAQRAYEQALPIYRAIEARLGEANTLQALGDLYVRTARLAEAQRAYEQALPIYRAIEARLGEANTLQALGDLYVRTDRLAEAQRAYEQALPIYRAIEDRLGEANTLQALGDLYVRTDRLAEAQRAYEQALPIYRAIEDRLGEANTLKALGDLYVRTARLAEAQRAYEQALPIYRAIEARLGEANTLQALGDLYVRTARLAEAQRAYEQALPIYRAIEARLGEANTLQALGDLYVRTARLAEAQRAYEQALPIYRAIEDRLGEANTLRALGDLYVRTDRLAEAQRAYEQALPIYRAIEDRLGEANTLRALGDLYVRTDRLAEAQRAYEQALPIYRAIEARLGEANTLKALGDLYVRTARLAEAQRAYEQALPIYRAIEARLGEANTLQALGDLYVRTDRLAEAQRAYEQALPIYRAIEDRLGEANTLQGLGSLALAHGRPADAFFQYLASLRIQATVEDKLGQGGTHGYLARAAAQAGQVERAVVLASRALSIFVDIEDRFGQMLVASDALPLLAQREDEGTGATLVFVWASARLIGDGRAQHYEPVIRQLGIDPDTALPEELREQALAAVQETFARYEQLLAERGEDPYGPLEPA